MTRSTVGLVAPSISSGVSAARRSHALSISKRNVSISAARAASASGRRAWLRLIGGGLLVGLAGLIAGLRRVRPAARRATTGVGGRGERAVVLVADLEHVLGALAEGGDARIVHAQALLAQHARDVGEQARTIVADDADQVRASLRLGEPDLRDDAEMAQVARLAAPRGHAAQVAASTRCRPVSICAGAGACRGSFGNTWKVSKMVASGPSSARACRMARPARSSPITIAANRPSRSGACTSTSATAAELARSTTVSPAAATSRNAFACQAICSGRLRRKLSRGMRAKTASMTSSS